MTDILVPADPADLIDRIVGLQLRIDTTDDPVLQTELRRKHALLLRLADRIMPPDDRLQDLVHQLGDARRDLRTLVIDLQACDSRKDYGVGFVALSQAMLAAIISAEEARAGINLCFARLGEGPVGDMLHEP
ncbi:MULTISPECIES: hypothetical protein [unclassified Yoonia]|uniref:hypothetical protein n=1 Tax=unclassified Yoonia TaxID=2629118 RepID=UPI002AFF0B31|nr:MULTISPECIES: hypothetical protein [unclassified Yoonia]